jgi:integrase
MTEKKAKRSRGEGRLYRPKFKDENGTLKEQSVWWLKWYKLGASKPVRESSGTSNKREAQKLLTSRLDARNHGRPVGPDLEKTTWDELAKAIEDDYIANGKRSLKRLKGSLKHLSAEFKGVQAFRITEERIAGYKASRKMAGAANGTINRELTALKRAFKLCRKRVPSIPDVAMLAEATARQGFFERADLDALLPHLPEDLRAPIEVAFITGWRVASEIYTRTWAHVDFGPASWECCGKARKEAACPVCKENRPGGLRLEVGETKNGDGREFPLVPELRAVLERQRARTTAVEEKTGQTVPWVFHRAGSPIRTIQKDWNAAIKAAKLDGKLPHDFRRTTARALERASVPRSQSMKLLGMKTESIFRRYAIVSSADLVEAGKKLAAFHASQTAKATPKGSPKATGTVWAQLKPRPARKRRPEVGRNVLTVRGMRGEKLEAASGFEPENRGFADLRLNHLATPPPDLPL